MFICKYVISTLFICELFYASSRYFRLSIDFSMYAAYRIITIRYNYVYCNWAYTAESLGLCWAYNWAYSAEWLSVIRR